MTLPVLWRYPSALSVSCSLQYTTWRPPSTASDPCCRRGCKHTIVLPPEMFQNISQLITWLAFPFKWRLAVLRIPFCLFSISKKSCLHSKNIFVCFYYPHLLCLLLCSVVGWWIIFGFKLFACCFIFISQLLRHQLFLFSFFDMVLLEHSYNKCIKV